MPKPSLMDVVAETKYEKINECFLTGNDEHLNEEQRLILKRWKSAYEILDVSPVKRTAIAKLRELYPISETQAADDVNNAVNFWSKRNKYDRDYIDAFLVTVLTEKISNPDIPEHVKARHVATLEKMHSNIPPQEIDPQHIEKNTINMNFNILNKSFIINETGFGKLSETKTERFLDSISNEILDIDAKEILNT